MLWPDTSSITRIDAKYQIGSFEALGQVIFPMD